MDWATSVINIVHIAIALVLGAIIGFERERAGHAAGIRTHMLVCGTSAFVMAVMMMHFSGDSIARVVAALLTGIGFIGAGTIISHGKTVHGLTTAGSVWAVAGLGIIVSLGAYLEAIFVAIVFVLVLEMKFFAGIKRKI